MARIHKSHCFIVRASSDASSANPCAKVLALASGDAQRRGSPLEMSRGERYQSVQRETLGGMWELINL